MSDGPTFPDDSGSPDDSLRSGAPRAMKLDLTSEPERIAGVRKAVEAFALSAGLGTSSADLGLVVNEALANVMRHAYQGRRGQPISVWVDCDASEVTVRIRDWGNGVNPAAMPARAHDPATPGGLGLICLRSLMDRVEFTPQPDGMLLTISKRRP